MNKCYNKMLIYIATGLFALILVSSYAIHAIAQPFIPNKSENFSKNWLISLDNQKTYKLIKDISVTDKIQTNKTVYIKKAFDTNIENPMLIIKTIYKYITVQIDNDVIYSYDKINTSNPGKSLHIIPVPNNFNGKELILSIYCPFEFYSNSLCSICISSPSSITTQILSSSMPNIIIGIILLVIGLLQAFMYLFGSFKKKQDKKIIYFLVFSLLTGTYFILDNSVANIFINPSSIANIQITCLYSTPLFIYLLLCSNAKVKSMLVSICLRANCIFTLFSILCMLTKLIRLTSLLHIFITVVIMDILVISLVCAIEIKKSNKSNLNTYITIFILIMFYILHRINVRYNILSSKIAIYKYLFLIVMLYYAFINYLAFCSKVLSMSSIIKNNINLKTIAYSDKMTNLKNRYSFEITLDNLSKKYLKDGTTAIIVFDLNKLKYINDKYGHSSGDKYIKLCASCLTETFISTNNIYRIGGDEFVVIINNTNFKEIESLIDELYNKLNKEKFIGFSPSIAYGFAFYDSFLDVNLYNTFNRADKKMYLNKSKQKKL